MKALLEALTSNRRESIAGLLAEMEAPQLADLLESLSPDERISVWDEIDTQVKGDVLVEAHGEVRAQLIEASTPDELAKAMQRLDLDELSDLYDEVPADVIEAVLAGMDAQRRIRFELVREYEQDSAGGLMDVDAIAVRTDITLAMVLGYLTLYRTEQGRLPDQLDAVSVTDLDGRYLGRLALADLVSLDGGQRVYEVMDTSLSPIPATMPAVRVARLFEDQNLVSAPVVDASGRLIGRITVDDVLDFVRAQADHTAMAVAGLDEDTDTFAPALASARRRAVWLGINLVNALIAAAVIGLFDATIERVVALAVLMPVVSSMGGVAGTQSLTLVIRALALEHINPANRWRLLRRELAVAAINGVVWAAAVGLLASAWFGNTNLSLVFGAAIVVNLVAGVTIGTLIPLVLERLRIDAVIAGQVLLVAFTDTFGFFVFLGMAAWFLR
ncbi:MAG: magnesium transporter [Sterolibacteriaceae bacterium]|nr:magnesium transporter [Sterolibacteriaceae bacterium]MBK9085579.1 magnesium transporter [Sterolibacteriaceae bacterium]